ncbi:MAG: response regulator [Ignavibacteria bacterium]|nr:response regulator [Ignavibacteria bacterium]
MKKKILIIDDDPDIVEATKLFLEYSGFEVLSETDPGKGAVTFLQSSPDLVILDVIMNDPDEGFFLAKKFKKSNPEIPVIIYSSVSKALGYSFGKSDMISADKFIDKPAEPKVLLDSINELLKSYHNE